MKDRPPCRLFVILARDASTGVIFRRGPSKWVRIIKWNTDTDTFESGHWFHGRIYEKYCDLSPDGSLLIYYAWKFDKNTDHSEYTHAWTAISKPPWITALTLWFKGDPQWGGGLFPDDKTIWLNQDCCFYEPDKGNLPSEYQVLQAPNERDQQDFLYKIRLKRDGWKLRQEIQYHKISYGYATDKPEIWSKDHPKLNIKLLMVNSMKKFSLHSNYRLELQENSDKHFIDNAEWAEWDHRGRLVFTKEGKLFISDINESGEHFPIQIADFNDDEPTSISPPEWAMKW